MLLESKVKGFLVVLLICSHKFYSALGALTEISVLLLHSEAQNLTAVPTLVLAQDDLYRDGILDRSKIQFKNYNEEACTSPAAPGAFVDWHIGLQTGLNVLIGPVCTAGMIPAAAMASHFGIPVVAYLSIGSELDDKTVYSTLARVSETAYTFGITLRYFLEMYEWDKIAAVVNTKNDFCSDCYDGLRAELSKSTIDITAERLLELHNGSAPLDANVAEDVFKHVKSSARIVFLCLGVSIRTPREYLLQALEHGAMTEEYVYIIPQFGPEVDLEDSFLYPWAYSDGRDDVSRETYKHVIVFNSEGSSNEMTKVFMNKRIMPKAAGSPWFATSVPPLQIPNQYLLLHDAMYLYGLAIASCLRDTQCSVANGRAVFKYMTCRNFEGESGVVATDITGERRPEFEFSAMDKSGSMSNFLRIFPITNCGNNTTDETESISDRFEDIRQQVWFTKDGKRPNAEPTCGFEQQLCLRDTTFDYLAVGGTVMVLLVLTGTVYAFYKKRSFEKSLLEMSWKIDRSKILAIKSNMNMNSSARSMMSVIRNSERKETECWGKFGGIVKYNEGFCAEIKYPLKEALSFSRSNLVYLKQMRELNECNLNTFIGMTSDRDTTLVILWAYCQRGSLEDILLNEDINLDNTFKSSMINDILKGLHYLHKSPIRCHGLLSASNCLVDNRWVVKLTNFGLHVILQPLLKSKIILANKSSNDTLLHRSPEQLRALENNSFIATPESDVYSYAMVVYQIVARKQLYWDEKRGLEGILNAIKTNSRVNGYLIRPKIVKDMATGEFERKLFTLMPKCWAENPEDRLKISEVSVLTSGALEFHSKNIIDHMISIMEKYSNNLEKIVSERTTQLVEERKRADELLGQMLPKTIAENLMSGIPVQPENFEFVTIYFSDIVGFTALASRSSPFEIIDLLNALYSHFDSIIDTFDAYKVETIGDAYMVVSGLPIRNETEHVYEIADMSLEIREFVKTSFLIPNTKEKVKIRIGVHTGPCAAGVVGVKMPRYCLFGDTVNMASRLESNGMAMMIHISEQTKEMLAMRSAYQIELRGLVELKGKGTIQTYWLLGKTDISMTKMSANH